MPKTLQIDSNMYNALIESFGEDALKEKIDDLLISAIEKRLEQFSSEILKFEEKYGVSFGEFEQMWDRNEIKDKHSHEVEGDFIDWEMLEMEKRELFSALSRLKSIKKK